MKIKQLRNVVAGLFPAQYGPVFDKANTAKEIKLVADAIGIAAVDANKREFEFMEAHAKTSASIVYLEQKIQVLEGHLNRAQQIATVRDPVEPKEEVFLVPPPSGPATTGNPTDFRNKISLIKAVREVSGIGLKEAKDLVEDVLDRGLKKYVFKGSFERAAGAVRVLQAAGGVTERKEAF